MSEIVGSHSPLHTDSIELQTLRDLVMPALKNQHGQFVFLTGRAGTGKSTLLRQFVAATDVPKAVLAPTGLAAINVQGQTIHSFFNFHLGPLEKDPDLLPIFKRGGPKHRLINKLQILIIDEISMVRADLLDAIDASLRWNRNIDKPFGGVAVLAVGDPWQLEPVVSTPAESEFLGHLYASPFFFDSHVVRETGMDIYELHNVHRQTDPEYLWALDRIRTGDVSELGFFNDRVGAKLNGNLPLILTATNKRAQSINLTRLASLPGAPTSYNANVEGDFGKDFPTEPVLSLKPGAQVMFVKNGKQWVNGTLGEVTAVEPDLIKVRTQDEKQVEVSRETWEKSRYSWNRATQRIDTTPIGTFIQFPLRLAWAVTSHKSQGLTLENLIVDLDRPAFSHGQTYVALSRGRTRQGLSLVRPVNAADIIVDPRVLEFAGTAGLVRN